MNNLGKLKSLKSNTASETFSESLVIKEFLDSEEGNLPLVIKPRFKGVDLSKWIMISRKEFDDELLKYGAILFRGFDINDLSLFGKFVEGFDTSPLPYMFRSSPRSELDKAIKNVYNSTVHPKEEKINLHNESSYSRNWGMKILFYCLQPALENGETPIADSRKIVQDIPEDLVRKFKDKGVLYKRRLIKDVGMSWQEVFQTESKQEVIDICLKNDIKYHFINENHLEIEWHKKAVYNHPSNGAETWFNHIYFFNKFSRYIDLGVSLNEELSTDLIHTNTLFGDGVEITQDEYLKIKEAYDKNTILFQYEKNDILFLDNMLTAHGRNSYTGDRLIATAILEPAKDQ